MRARSSGDSATSSAAQRFGELGTRPRADDRHDRRSLREHPRDGELRGRDALLGGQLLQRVDQPLIALAVLAGEARQVRAEVAARRRLRAAEQPARQHAVRGDADVQLRERREESWLRVRG